MAVFLSFFCSNTNSDGILHIFSVELVLRTFLFLDSMAFLYLEHFQIYLILTWPEDFIEWFYTVRLYSYLRQTTFYLYSSFWM
jgi:hypothetical protein